MIRKHSAKIENLGKEEDNTNKKNKVKVKL